MLRVEPIDDMELVRLTMTVPHIWDATSDDGYIKPSEFNPKQTPGIYWIGVWDDDKYLGLFLIETVNVWCCDSHVAMLPWCGGRRAIKAHELTKQWIWTNTTFRRIITATPSCNKLGLKFARMAGFVKFGLNPKSWLKNGELHDLVLSGVDLWADNGAH